MLNIAELTSGSTPWRNYYCPDAYLKGDTEFGLIESRSGSRLMALPEPFLEALLASLKHETGQAAEFVLFQCGYRWGKKFYRRFTTEVSEFYQKPLAQLEMIHFLQCLKQCWKTHGWGVFDLDLNHHQQGVLIAQIKHSTLAHVASQGRSCYLEAGLLSAFFSQLTGQDLDCIQTASVSEGAESNTFIIGLKDRLKPVKAWISEDQDHNTILTRLCPISTQHV